MPLWAMKRGGVWHESLSTAWCKTDIFDTSHGGTAAVARTHVHSVKGYQPRARPWLGPHERLACCSTSVCVSATTRASLSRVLQLSTGSGWRKGQPLATTSPFPRQVRAWLSVHMPV